MFCKNCGRKLDENSNVCGQCGFAAGVGSNYCKNCGAQTVPGQTFCTSCGTQTGNNFAYSQQAYNQNGQTINTDPNAKSRLAAGILGILLGTLGVHNFYLGYTSKAVIQLVVSLVGAVVTCGIATLAIEIWTIIEGIFYLTQHEGYTTDATGRPLKD